MYKPMGWSPADSIASSNNEYSHSLPAPHFVVLPVIRHAARWWNAIRTLSISPVTNQLSLSYNVTDCAATFYIAQQARNVDPVMSITLAIVPHCLRALQKFMYAASHSLLF